ncbi:MAG: hypothetical protein LBT12_04365 [Oscillospiraceae bacterium]|jgi:hypothetical protein|nr:hypothetical protein [Oscillospiraceae bacterium]
MKRERGASEAVQNLVIAALLISAVLLGWGTGLFNDFFASISLLNLPQSVSGVPAGYDPAVGVMLEAARPASIVVTNENGERAFAKYDTDALDLLYERTGGILGEALGAAAEAEPCNEAQWRGALGAPGILFEYATPISLPILGGWLGAALADTGGEIAVRQVCVVFGDGVNRLFFRDARDGTCYASETISFGAPPQIPGQYGDAVEFVFERADVPRDGAPYMALSGVRAHPVVSAANPLEPPAAADALLASLGVSQQLKTSYPESDGTQVFVTNAFTFSLSPDGFAVYRHTAAIRAARESVTESAAIELARRAAADTVGAYSADGRVYFSGIEPSGGGYAVTFDYFVAGGRVYLPGGEHAARVILRDGTVTEMSLYFRSYTVTGETVALLPEKQALAAAGRAFSLCYSDTSGGGLEPYWATETEADVT